MLALSANIVNSVLIIREINSYVGGKFNNNINTTTSYIEVVSGLNGEIMSIIVDPVTMS